KPGLTWHDGQPVTADDFAFGWEFLANPIVPKTPPQGFDLITGARAADPQTLVLTFKSTSPLAGQALFQPYPRHLLDTLVATGDIDRIMHDDFWSTAFVGAGPYKLERWDRGSSIEYSAFAGYALGKPKIDTLQVRFLGDPNTLLATVLSGDVD